MIKMKKNTIIILALVLMLIICYLVYISGKAEGKEAKQPMTEQRGEK